MSSYLNEEAPNPMTGAIVRRGDTVRDSETVCDNGGRD